jgi:Low temperature viability protein
MYGQSFDIHRARRGRVKCNSASAGRARCTATRKTCVMGPKSIYRQPGAQHFQLVRRSQRDPLIHDPEASQHVLKGFERENRKVRGEECLCGDSTHIMRCRERHVKSSKRHFPSKTRPRPAPAEKILARPVYTISTTTTPSMTTCNIYDKSVSTRKV